MITGEEPETVAAEYALGILSPAGRAILKVGLMCTIAPHNLIGIVRGFAINIPGIELRIVDATAAELSGQLKSGALDDRPGQASIAVERVAGDDRALDIEGRQHGDRGVGLVAVLDRARGERHARLPPSVPPSVS